MLNYIYIQHVKYTLLQTPAMSLYLKLYYLFVELEYLDAVVLVIFLPSKGVI